MENEIFEELDVEIFDDLPIADHIDWDNSSDDEWYTDAFME